MAENDEQMIYLHGDLELDIYEARSLPNMDIFSERLRRCFTLCDACSAAESEEYQHHHMDQRKVQHRRKIITSDPYVTVTVPQVTLARTRVLTNSQVPVWNEHFYIPLAHPLVNLEFHIKDDDVFGSQTMGKVLIPAQKLVLGEPISGWFPIIACSGKPPKPDSALRVKLSFIPCDKNPIYKHGIAGDPDNRGVRNTYFPLRKGNSVTLYQDAHHVESEKLPKIEIDGGLVRHHGTCWEDICYAISEAHHLIYIVGWSVFHKIKLIREPTKPLPRGGDLTLGELLKYKSQEGVRVLLLVWDDKTSHDKILINTVTIDVTGLNRLYSTYNPLSQHSHSGFRTAEHMYDCRACKGKTGFINVNCEKCFGFGYGNEIVDEMLLGIDRETEMTQWAICRLVYFWAETHSPPGYIRVAGNIRRSMKRGVLADHYANWKTKLGIDEKTDRLLNFPGNTRDAYGNNMHGLNHLLQIQ